MKRIDQNSGVMLFQQDQFKRSHLHRRDLRIWRRLTACLMLVGFAVTARSQEGGSAAETQPSAVTRWAIIATSESAIPLADLLTADLSKWQNIELVERDQIQLVLQELDLNASGLVDVEHRTQFVELTGADALVLIDAGGDDRKGAADNSHNPLPGVSARANPLSKNGRLRLVDARTSVRLVDTVLPSTDLESQLASVSEQLEKARGTLSLSPDRLRLIGVISIKSEEPGEQLEAFCQSLTKLVEFQLHRLPEFVVLERTDLMRLIDEKNVSGKELEILSAARLLETGLRRATDGNAMEVTCRLVSPRRGQRETIRLSVGSSDIRRVRDAIVQAVTSELSDRPTEIRAPLDPSVEAEVFDRRRQWLHSAYRFDDAAEMAEVAYALDPTIDRLKTALQEYRLWKHTYTNRSKRPPEMSGYDRLLADYNQRTLRPKLREGQNAISAIRAYAMRPLKRGTEADYRLREQHRVAALTLFEKRLAEVSDDPIRKFAILLERLEIAFVLAPSDQELFVLLPKWIDQIIQARKDAGLPESVSDRSYERFVMSAIRLLTRLDYMMRSDDQLKNAASLRNQWSDYLSRQQELAIVAADLVRRSQPRGGDGDVAALKLLDLMRDWVAANANTQTVFEMKYRRSAFTRVNRTPLRKKYLEIILSRAESQKDVGELVRDAAHLQSILSATPTNEKLAVAARIGQTMDRLAEEDQTSDDHEALANLRRQVKDQLVRSRLIQADPPKYSLDNDVGPWQEYFIRPISLADPDPKHAQMLTMYVDRRDDARQRGGRVLMAWSLRGTPGLSIERIDLETGKSTAVGPVIPGYPRSFRGVPLAIGPDAVYAATKTPGFTIIKEGSIETLTEADGAPSNDVFKMAWYKDRLYIAYADALATFDPVTRRFTLLASSMSVEPRNLIDGRGSFFIRYLIPDEANDCLWLSIQDNALPRDRNGFWRFKPESNEYTKISGSHVAPHWIDGGFLLHRSATPPWAHVDRATGELTELGNYSCWSNPSSAWQEFVMLGEHILTSRCLLFTPDGQQFKASTMTKWPHLHRVGTGCITQFDGKTNTLWYLQPK
ncbi:MAG: hypothetical protein HKN47_23210 [Pirellulaceae bacterium]|nr:hypothetical protein [Pirellulaceae bacterium]